MTADPPVVERFAAALADWLASYTVPPELGAEMADACAAGSAWAAAIGGTAVRRTGWTDTEALTWGISVGALAGALEGARKSLLAHAPPAPARADGPARPLLAADGLVAAAHEALAALAPERLRAAMAALAHAFGGGGAWRGLSSRWPRPAWAALVPLALQPAAVADPAGSWAATAAAWEEAYGVPASIAPEPAGVEPDEALWRHAAADAATRRLLRAAASAALEVRAGA